MSMRKVRYIGSLPGEVRTEFGPFTRGEAREVTAGQAELLVATRVYEYADSVEQDGEESLSSKNVDELREIAASLEVEGRSGMNKSNLIRAIKDARSQEVSS